MKIFHILFILLVLNANLIAQVIIAGPADFRTYLSDLESGDTLYLAPGIYTQSLRIVDLSGNEQHPILISGQPGQPKPVFLGNSCCNTISLTRSAFVHIRDIICDGQDVAGIDALKAEGSQGNWTHHIEVEGLELYGYGADQQNVGISTKCPSWNWWIHHNIIDAAGTGFYLGNSDGNQPFVNGLIEYNLVMNTLGYNGQVKHQNTGTRDLSLGMPAEGVTSIRYNVFSKAANASTGSLARPNLLVGNFPATGPGSSDHYEIYGNFFFQNPVEALFQGTGNIGFYHNVLFNNAGGWGVSVQTHEGFQPRAIDIFFNTVVVDGQPGISISGVNSAFMQRVWGNAVFSMNPLSGGSQLQNITAAYSQVSAYLTHPSLPLNGMDLTPDANALDITGIDLSTFSKYQAAEYDFDGKKRPGRVAGAYSGELPLWPLQMMRRDQVDLQDFISDLEIVLDESSINIYPSPAHDFLKISGALSEFEIKILDQGGAIYQTLDSNAQELDIDIQGLPSGIFFVSIFSRTHSRLSMVKLIKM